MNAMPQFATRTLTPELMDTESVAFETFRDCLTDLAAVNRLTLAYRPTLAFLDRLRRTGRFSATRPIRILDVGAGYGDMLRLIDRWAQRHGVAVALTGLDLNPWAAQAAAAATPGGRPIRWLTADVFAYEGEIDLVISSLFTHHLDDETVARFMAWMEARASIGWFINDLHRLAFPYYGFALLSRLMRWHRFVRHDGPVSIARSFRPRDWLRLSDVAGLAPGSVEVTREFPFRLCVARAFPA